MSDPAYNWLMSSLPSYNPHYTVADYEQWEGDWELWNGVAVAMSPSPNRRHQRILLKLAMLVEDALTGDSSCHCQVVSDVDWRIADDTVVRPDLSVLCEHDEAEFISRPPTLITEVLSPATASKDRTSKRGLYERMGVGWYLIVDPQSPSAEALQLVDGSYREMTPVDSELRVDLHEGCSISLDLANIFPD